MNVVLAQALARKLHDPYSVKFAEHRFIASPMRYPFSPASSMLSRMQSHHRAYDNSYFTLTWFSKRFACLRF